MQNVFIIGSKGIPASYGGYETFVDKLTEYHQTNDKIKYLETQYILPYPSYKNLNHHKPF